MNAKFAKNNLTFISNKAKNNQLESISKEGTSVRIFSLRWALCWILARRLFVSLGWQGDRSDVCFSSPAFCSLCRAMAQSRTWNISQTFSVDVLQKRSKSDLRSATFKNSSALVPQYLILRWPWYKKAVKFNVKFSRSAFRHKGRLFSALNADLQKHLKSLVAQNTSNQFLKTSPCFLCPQLQRTEYSACKALRLLNYNWALCIWILNTSPRERNPLVHVIHSVNKWPLWRKWISLHLIP